MSYIVYKMRCKKCKREWDTSFGIVGTTRIAEPTIKCPHCNAPEIENVDHPWSKDEQIL